MWLEYIQRWPTVNEPHTEHIYLGTKELSCADYQRVWKYRDEKTAQKYFEGIKTTTSPRNIASLAGSLF